MKKLTILLTIVVTIITLVSCNKVNISRNEVDVSRNEVPVSYSEVDIKQLVQLLGSDDLPTREKAQRQLEDIGEPAEAVLNEALKNSDPEVQGRVARILEVIAIKKRVKFSITFMKEFPNIYRDLRILDCHGKIGLIQTIATNKNQGFFVKAEYPYKDKVTNNDLAALIGETLLYGGDKLDYMEKKMILSLIAMQLHFDSAPRLAAEWYTPIPEDIPYILGLLYDKSDDIRQYVCNTLVRFKAKEAIPEIIKILKSDDERVRDLAIETIDGLQGREAIPELIKLLNNRRYQRHVIDVLVNLNAKEAIPEITKVAASMPDEAIKAIERLGGKESIPYITGLLSSTDKWVLHSALSALDHLEAKESIPEMKKLLSGTDKSVTYHVAEILAKLNDNSGFGVLVSLMNENDNIKYRGNKCDVIYTLIKYASPAIYEKLYSHRTPKDIVYNYKNSLETLIRVCKGFGLDLILDKDIAGFNDWTDWTEEKMSAGATGIEHTIVNNTSILNVLEMMIGDDNLFTLEQDVLTVTNTEKASKWWAEWLTKEQNKSH